MNQVIEEVIAEEIPNTLDKQIQHELVKHNVTDAVISSLKQKYGSLKLKSIDDKESYLEIKESRKEVRKVGILVEKICKSGREDANRIQKLWLEKEREVSNKILAIQDPLDVEIKKFDDEVERKETEEKNRREAEFQNRQATLIKYGAQYNNGSFDLNHISYEVENIRESDIEIWEGIILPKYKAEFEKVQAQIVAEENKRAEEARILKEQQDKLKEEQEEFNRQKKELEDAQAAMQKIKDDNEREKNRIKQDQENQLFQIRSNELKGINWNGQEAMFNNEVVLTHSELINLSDEGFNIVRDSHNKIVADIESKKLADRLAKEEADRKLAVEKALQEERDRLAKQKVDDELKAAQEAQRKAEELLAANDKEKWSYLLSSIANIQIPEMKSPAYRKKVAILKEKIQEVNDL